MSDETTETRRRARPARRPFARPGLLLGIAAGAAVLLTLGGPGLTIDEPLDVRPGRTYVATLRAEGPRFFSADVVTRVFRDNAEHPPLGRWLLGIASTVGEPVEVLTRGVDPTGIYVLSGRLAPALAFALLVAAIAAEAGRRWGLAAAYAAGGSLAMMPRAFAHAHLGALDTFLALFWTLALLAGARAMEKGGLGRSAGAGLVWSLALLTKIHAWLLWPLMAGWAACRLRRRAPGAIAAWTIAGVVGFVAGWPWLWYDTIARWRGYWWTSVARTPIMVEYFGRVTADRDVPWHYPWVYFAVTVPVGLQLLGVLGLARGWKGRKADPFPLLLATSIGLFLVLFSTRVPVYDGERLFLHVFPAWAMLIGLGFGDVWERAGRVATSRPIAGRSRLLRAGAVAFLLAQGAGTLSVHPFGLSYYNLLVGGLRGAEALGLELTYWGDAVDRVLLDRLAAEASPGAEAAIAPTLYPSQGIATTTAALLRRKIILADEEAATRAEWVAVSRRRAYWKPELAARLASGGGRLVLERARQGVWLAALWHFPPPAARAP
ncbi:glycosyltransferase family 39 protein [Aquisphaera insulae]|uniref:glycosyltransferase family 39 protein n=1 Tax=Aquisphaera insulae TaxID=2712864 RepID=UPI0013ED8C50|nr:glycosyltransferase family 39 protein [Aquisphaera insulae]